ncbi:MAG TPA: DinB family protein [Candidatus Limnocylindrales bacterium]|nr:DinB family protein [Candidatus Limnocylindrales bacterium]
MSLSEALLPEFDQEMATARKTLERVPDDKLAWKPHPKSGSFGWLAGHIANIPGWATMTIKQDGLDMAPNGVPIPQPPEPKNRKELLEVFDKNVAESRAALAGATDAHLYKPWSLLNNGQAMITMPRIACLRSWVLNHLIHHRAQLGVYLRLNNIPVPSTYGPSADEGAM